MRIASRGSRMFLALVVAIGMLAIPQGPTAPVEVRAATPDLTVVGAARYVVQPDKRRVRVTVDLTLKNHLKDTKTKRYYFDEAFLAIQPGTSGYKLSWEGSGSPSVRATRKTRTHTLLRLDLAKRLYSGKTARYRLTFNLNDPGGAPTRDLRVGDSLVSFPVWAFATDSTPGSTVSVTFPAGYDVKVEAGEIPEPTMDESGRTIFQTGKLDAPLAFFAYLVADRPGAYATTTVTTDVLDTPVGVTIRSWPDDEPWAERVGGLVESALPVLGTAIGVPWPHEEPLTIQEAVSRSTGGYAGLFDPTSGLVEIAYYANDFVVLHEAAHAWFNGSLLADRWANEAFASYYAEQAALALDVKARGVDLSEELEASRIPLNAWGPVGSDTDASEDFAYAASLTLAESIAERAGPEGLRAVWADAAARLGAYQPPGGFDEFVEGPPDWRGFLDLLEGHTDATYDDLWRAWVARPSDEILLDQRAAARARYDALLPMTDGWRVPRPVREALRTWQFETATGLIDDAEAVLDLRAEVEAAAAETDLILPASLQLSFEDEDGFDDAFAEAQAELDVIGRYADAVALRPREQTPILALGLWGETPDVDLDTARDAFARGDLTEAATAVAAASVTWSGAESLGQGRAISLVLLFFAAVLTVIIAVTAIRRRRRRSGGVVRPAMERPAESATD